MFRKSALAMAIWGTVAAQSAFGLGLGEISLNSALNQPLQAEVELLSVTDKELRELRINMGSREAFASAGIDRPNFLTKLKFTTERKADGGAVIKITSRDSIREPFLDFLLEVVWANGKLLREYTVLVDPPVTMPAPAPVAQAPVVEAPAPASAPSPAPTPARAPAPAADVGVASGDRYGPTGRNDTLWKIAEQVRPDRGVSMEQTMLGLLNANPDAFYKHNINNLKAGYVLRVPTRDDLAAVSRAEAKAEVRMQNQEWREGRPRPSRLASAPAVAPPAAKLELVAPQDQQTGAAEAGRGEGLGSLRKDLVLATEAAEVQRRQTQELESRLQALEEQITKMQRLIELKDDQLALLQDQAGEAAATPPTDAAAPAEGVDADALEQELFLGEGATEMPADEAEAAAEPTPMEVPEATSAAPGEAEPAPAEAVPAPQPSPVPPPFEESQSLVDKLMANPLWLAAGALLLALLAWLGMRLRKGGEPEFQESILQEREQRPTSASAPVVEPMPEPQEASMEDEAVAEESESSLLSEFATSDLGSIQNQTEADPMAEADVYLAYGRYQQAEDLIKGALAGDADREDLNLKLFEIYAAAQNRSDFDAHAEKVLASLESQDHPLWEKVCAMGVELNPDNPLYRGGDAAPADASSPGALELGGAMAAEPLPADDAPPAMQPSQDFAEAPLEPVPAADNEDQGLDFDMDLAGLSESAAEADSEAPLEETDFSLDMEPEQAAAEEPVVGDEDNGMEFDLGELNLDSDLTADLEGEPAAAEDVPGDGLLADVDEVATKLDLARAYIDMGDPEGARSILDEVMEEGNDDQKGEAQELLTQL